MFKRFTNIIAPITAMLACAVVLSTVAPTIAAVSVSQLGLQNVNLDTRQGGPAQAFTPISTQLPRITEGVAGDISAGATAIVINTPVGGGWAFRVVGVPTATPVSGNIVLGAPVVFPLFINIPVVTPSTIASVIEVGNIEIIPTGCTGLGSHNFRVTTDAGGAGDLNNATLATVTLNAGPSINSYGIATNSPQTAATPVTVTLSALDGCGNLIPNAVVPAAITIEADITGATLPIWGDGAPFVITNKNVVPNQATIAAGSAFNGSGQGTFTVTNSNCEETTALFLSDASPIPDVLSGISWNNSKADAAISSLLVQGVPPNPIADGVDARSIQVTLRDQCGNPIAGKQVSLSVQSATNAGAISISPTSATTNASGQATFQVRSSLAQVATFRALDKTNGVVVTQTGVVTFAPNVTLAANSSVVAAPAAIRADGIETSIITITLRNSLSNPVAGHPVALTAGPGTVTVAPAVAGVTTTDSNGRVSFTAKSTTPQVTALTFSDTTVPAVALAPVAITFNNTVDLVSGVVGVTRTAAATNVDFNYTVNSPVNVSAFNIRLGLDTNNDASTLEATLVNIAGEVTPGAHAIATADVRAALNALATPVKNGDRIVAVLDTGATVTETAEGNNTGVSAGLGVDLVPGAVSLSISEVETAATFTYTVDAPANVAAFALRFGIDTDGNAATIETFLTGDLLGVVTPGAQSTAAIPLRAALDALATPIKLGDRIVAVLDTNGTVAESNEASDRSASSGFVVDIVAASMTIDSNLLATLTYVVNAPARIAPYSVQFFLDSAGVPVIPGVPGDQALDSAGDTPVGGAQAGSVIPGSHTATQSFTGTPPVVNQRVFGLADSARVIAESNDNALLTAHGNNAIVATNSTGKNIIATNVVVTSTGVTATAKVFYSINSPVPLGAFNIEVAVDRNCNGAFDPPDDVVLATVPAAFLTQGTHSQDVLLGGALNALAARLQNNQCIVARVDSANAIAGEDSEADNLASETEKVDLIGNALAVSVDLTNDRTTAIASYTVSSPAAVTPFAFQLGLDRNNDLAADAGGNLGAAFTPIGGLDDDGLDYTFPGSHRVTLNEFRADLNAQAPRIQNTNHIIVNIDTANVVGENNETPASNVASQEQIVDLRIDSVTLNTAGSKYTGRVDYTIISPGNVDNFLVRLGLNNSGAANALAADVAGVVKPGAGSTGEIDLNPGLLSKAIAMNSSPNIVGFVDVTGLIFESDPANNEAAASAKYDVDVKLDALADFGTSAGIPFSATFTYNVIGHQPAENFQVSLFVSADGNATVSPGDKLLQLGATTDPATFVFTTAADKSVGAHTHTRIVKVAAGDAAGASFFIKARVETVLPAPEVLGNHVSFPDDVPATNLFARQNNPLGSLDIDLDGDGLTLRQEQFDGFTPNAFVFPTGGGATLPNIWKSLDSNPDSDGDGIPDAIELGATVGQFPPIINPAIGTDPGNRDTDGDGLLDGEEDANKNGIFEPALGETDPRNWDTDGDGLSDKEERDGFLITRYFGTTARFDALSTDPIYNEKTPFGVGSDRPDATGISGRNVRVVRVFTNPLVADTDGDGISDFDEVNTFALAAAADGSVEAIGLGPIAARAGLKFNLPGTRNGAGLLIAKAVMGVRTDPTRADTDGDGLADTVDPAPQINPTRVGFAAGIDQALLLNFDQDGDGFLEAPDANGDGIPDFSRYTEATLEQLFAIDFSNTGSLLDGFDVGGIGRGAVDPAVPGGAGCDPFPSRFGSYRIRGNGQAGGDGVLDRSDSEGGLVPTDNCPQAANPKQEDFDGDGLGDACDADMDNDGVPNSIDFFNQQPIRVCTAPGAANPGCAVGLASSTGLALFGLAGLKVGSRRRRRVR